MWYIQAISSLSCFIQILMKQDLIMFCLIEIEKDKGLGNSIAPCHFLFIDSHF